MTDAIGQRERPKKMMGVVISMKAYKYRRYVMDQPRAVALRLATLNHYQVLLEIRNSEKGMERGAE